MVGINFSGKKTVNGIMAGFTKMIKDLENLISDEVALNIKRTEEIRLMSQAMADSENEIVRAAGVVENLRVLLGE